MHLEANEALLETFGISLIIRDRNVVDPGLNAVSLSKDPKMIPFPISKSTSRCLILTILGQPTRAQSFAINPASIAIAGDLDLWSVHPAMVKRRQTARADLNPELRASSTWTS